MDKQEKREKKYTKIMYHLFCQIQTFIITKCAIKDKKRHRDTLGTYYVMTNELMKELYGHGIRSIRICVEILDNEFENGPKLCCWECKCNANTMVKGSGAPSLINLQAQRCSQSVVRGTNFHAFWARACARFARRPGAHEWPLMNNKFSAFSQSWMGTPVAKAAKKAGRRSQLSALTQ
jgi:hypothetical protein